MRYHVLRFDLWLCLLLSVGLAFGAGKFATKVFEQKYEDHKEEHKVSSGCVGGKATKDIFKAESIEDLLSHDTFTVVSPGIEYRNKGAGFYKGMYLYALTLPSGEKVAARINSDSVTHEGDSIYSGNSILPVGKIIKEDLTSEETFISQIEYKEHLDRKDFYIDMVGEGEIESEETFIEAPVMMIQVIIVLATFPLFHMVGSKFGIFPYIIPPKKLQENEWN